MLISYLIPTDRYLFFGEMTDKLRERGIDVEVNAISSDSDVVLVAIGPATSQWYKVIEAAGRPYILWHWDYYSFVNFEHIRWKWFLNHLPYAVDIWSCTYEVARQLKEVFGLDSYMMPSWVNAEELSTVQPGRRKYVCYAAHSGAMGKRVQWAEVACKLLRFPLKLTTREHLSRRQYLEMISQCRVYLMTAFEESNATIPAQEAGAYGKPVVLADLPASREVFGDTAWYFPTWDFWQLKTQLKDAWYQGAKPGVRDRILSNYSLDVVADRLALRLRQLYGTRISERPR